MRTICLLFSILFLSCVPESNTDSSLPDARVDKIVDHYITDRRVELFDVTKDSGSYTYFTTNMALKDSLDQWFAERHLSSKHQVKLLPPKKQEVLWALVNLSTVHMRSLPKHSAELVSQALMGTPVKVLQKKKEWWRIQTPEGYIGWVQASGLVGLSQEQLAHWKKSKRVLVTAFSERLYKYPDSRTSIVSDIVMGSLLQLSGKEIKGFKEVIMPNGALAWIDGYYLMDFDHLLKREATATALSFIGKEMNGVPYLWGGTSSKGLDCSGFTKLIFWMNGLLLPRDASQQVHEGQAVPLDSTLSQIVPGDLLFFGKKRNEGSPKITHVALHLGKGRILHSSGKVKTESLLPSDSLYNEDRRKSLLVAKRFLTVDSVIDKLSVQHHSWYF